MKCVEWYKLTDSTTTQIFACFFILFALIAAVGNSIALFVLRMPQMRSKSRKMLLSLVYSDMLVGYVILPICSWIFFKRELLVYCKSDIWKTFIGLYTTVSYLTVTLIAFERYIVIKRISNNHLGDRKVYVLIVLCWMAPVILSVVRYLSFLASTILGSLLLIFNVVALPVFYVLVTKAVRDSQRRMQTHNNTASRMSKKRQIKYAKNVLSLILCQMLCLLPTLIFLIVTILDKINGIHVTREVRMNLFSVSFLVLALNSCLNPLIYASRHPGFAQSCKRLFGRIRRRKESTQGTSTPSTFSHSTL